MIKSGSELIWLWIVIEPANKEILSFYISKERNMFVSQAISISGYKHIWKTSSFI